MMDENIADNGEESRAELICQVFDEDFERLFRVAYKIVLHYDDAQIVVSEAQVRALLKAHQLKSLRAVRGWVTMIVRNLAINFARKRKHWMRLDVCQHHTAEANCRLADPIRNSVEKENKDLVERAIERLRADLRVVIRAHYWEGKSMEEIAAETGVPAGTVKSRLHKARQQIAVELEGHFGDLAKAHCQRSIQKDVAAIAS